MNKAAAVGIGVVLLGAGYVGATVWSGQQIEARYREQLDRVPAKMPLVRILEQKYDKGLFASTGTATLGFGCPAEAGKPLPVVTITSSIRHGPIAAATLAMAVIDSQVRIAGGDADVLTAALGPGAPLTVHTVASFAGPVRSTLASPAVKLPLGKGAELDWQGLSGDVESSRDGKSVSYRVKSGGLTLTDPASRTTVRIGALAFQGDGRAITPVGALMAGQLQGTLDTIEVTAGAAGAQTLMTLTGLAFSTSTSTAIDGELLGGTSSIAAKGSFGDVKLDKIEMKISLKRLHAPTYQRLMETSTQELYRCGAADKAAALVAMQAKMQTELAALLRHGPEVSLDRLAVESGGLASELSYSVGTEGVTDADAAQPLPAMLMTRAYLRAAFRVPVVWLRQLSQATAAKLPGRAPDPSTVDVMLDQAQARGYVVRDGDYVKGEASYAKGALMVNGKPLVPPASR